MSSLVSSLKDRIGVDLGGRRPLEEGLEWAAAHSVRYLDCSLDAAGQAPNAPDLWTAKRCARVQESCQRAGVHLGLHTLSAVNIAETAPFVAEAVDRYLRAYTELAPRLGAQWIVVHGGLHFSSDYAARRAASLERLRRAVDHAERVGVRLLLENLNREPERAEVHYLAVTIEECREYLERIPSPYLGWAFTVNHAHLLEEGIDGFLDAVGLDRCGEVRLADSRGDYEQHLKPGEGTIDFGRMFRRIEGSGYRHHYMLAFGSWQDMLAGRDDLARLDRDIDRPLRG
jgi:sugar phosphate isomerase/epimerase